MTRSQHDVVRASAPTQAGRPVPPVAPPPVRSRERGEDERARRHRERLVATWLRTLADRRV